MNEFFQQNFFSIILFLIFIILLLVALIGIVLVRLVLVSRDKKTSPPPPAILEQAPSWKMKHIKHEEVLEKFFCGNHPDTPSTGGCLICEDVYCEKCLIEHEGIYFCKEHFKIYTSNSWKQITDVQTTPDSPEDGLFIYEYKRKIWQENRTPSFILTHYKINIENDYIESFIQLNVRESDSQEILEELKKLGSVS